MGYRTSYTSCLGWSFSNKHFNSLRFSPLKSFLVASKHLKDSSSTSTRHIHRKLGLISFLNSVKSLHKKATYPIVRLQPKYDTTACGNTSIERAITRFIKSITHGRSQQWSTILGSLLFFFCLDFRVQRWRYLRASWLRWRRLLRLERGFEVVFFKEDPI